jgi:hypothetical protein
VLGTADVARSLGATLPGYIDVAPLPAGWLVSYYAEPALFLVALDRAGQVVTVTRVDDVDVNEILAVPALASGPGGGSLFAWQNGAAIAAALALVAGDGQSLTRLPELAPGETAHLEDAAFIADGYRVALRAAGDSGPPRLRVLRILPDGQLDGAFDALPASDASGVSFVTGASDVRFIYETAASAEITGDVPAWSVVWQRFGAGGAAVTAPVLLAREPDFSGYARGVAFSDVTVAAVASFAAPSWIAILHVGSDGTSPHPPFKLTSGAPPNAMAIARRGPDAVVMWTSAKGIRLARLAIAGAVP